MAHLIRYEVHADQRYRIVQIGHGFLLSFALRGANGLPAPQEWLYRTREAAEKGFAFVVLMNAWWDAVASGCPADEVAEQCDTAASEHARAIEQLNDKPLMGAAVNAFRTPPTNDSQREGASDSDPDHAFPFRRLTCQTWSQ
jgi:hypothetical protein